MRTAADVSIACVLGRECSKDRGSVGSPEVLELVDRLVCVSAGGGLGRDGGFVQETSDKINECSDARPTKDDEIALCGSHGGIEVGFVL